MKHFALIAMLLCGSAMEAAADHTMPIDPAEAGLTWPTEAALTCHLCDRMAAPLALALALAPKPDRFGGAFVDNFGGSQADPDPVAPRFPGQNADWSFARVSAAVQRAQLPKAARWRAKGNGMTEAIDPVDPIKPVARSDLPTTL